MKTQRFFRRHFFSFTLVISGLLLMSSCEKDKDDNNGNTNNYSVSGNASGSQENPAVTTNGAGTLTGTYNSSTNKLDYTIAWTQLSGPATMIHLHGPAAGGVNAGVLIGLTISTNGISGTASGSVTLADSTEAHLLNGDVYYNIHTLTNPDGEIRGQITATLTN